MEKGYSTASPEVRDMGFGAGMGLPNIRANVDEFNITSEVNKGTVLDFFIKF
jgi:anti-sigma regulatory factor (Ser/Thr protein kinase)